MSAQTSSATMTEISAAISFAAQVAGLFPGVGTIVGELLQLEPAALGLVSSVLNMANSSRGPTAEELAALDAQITANSALIHSAADRARAQLATS